MPTFMHYNIPLFIGGVVAALVLSSPVGQRRCTHPFPKSPSYPLITLADDGDEPFRG